MTRSSALRYSSVLLLTALVAACGPVDSTPEPGGEGDGDGNTPPAAGIKEPVTFSVRLENHGDWPYRQSGVFHTPVGQASPGPLLPGNAYELTVHAGKAHRVSFAIMLGASNDWFYAPGPEGIPLYENGLPVSGDVTSHLRLWDSGSEMNEEPGVGPSTGPKQTSPDQGAADPDVTVREVGDPAMLYGGTPFDLPAVSEVLKVTITPMPESREFIIRIENVSQPGALKTSAGALNVGVSPGVFVVHAGPNPLFTPGQPDRGEGLALIAESGRIQTLAAAVEEKTGVGTGFSPAVWVVHSSGRPLYELGAADRGHGLESIAEDGNPVTLSERLASRPPAGTSSSGVVNTTEGGTAPGPVAPGQSYAFEIQARPGERLSLASMFGASNDWIVGAGDEGIQLFDADGQPLSGDFTAELRLIDVGTEQNELLAVGANTGPNQSGADTGPRDGDARVRIVTPDVYATSIAAHLNLIIEAKANATENAN